ncbi:hypothetical protein QFC20_004297 [Naganishia adeliensis]|uniref:Uncharacterized protein n=1 Tax=Naganishia adeliensis TaxID=92952 RepID=A0ACC2W4R2_9TREE|nr:hypothetical protein QFC20_004297 [Naganishia adeliensis]
MHLKHLIALFAAVTSVFATSNSYQDSHDALERSASDIEVRQPFNTYHNSHRFVGSVDAARRDLKRHRRGSDTLDKNERKQKRKVKKRSGKCAAKTSTATLSATSSSSKAPTSTPNLQNGAVSLPTSSASSTTKVTSAWATSSTVSSSAPATTSSAPSWTSVDTGGNGPFDGVITYYDLGTDGSAIGACGTSLVDSDKIAAAAASLFDSWPGATANPNTNPICGQYAKVSSGSASVIVQIQDRCPGCDERHLDLSPSAFLELAELSVGLMDVTWSWVETSSG